VPFGARPPDNLIRPPPSYRSNMAEPESLTCANCSTTILERDAEAAGWRYWSDGVGALHLPCEACAEISSETTRRHRATAWLADRGSDAAQASCASSRRDWTRSPTSTRRSCSAWAAFRQAATTARSGADEIDELEQRMKRARSMNSGDRQIDHAYGPRSGDERSQARSYRRR